MIMMLEYLNAVSAAKGYSILTPIKILVTIYNYTFYRSLCSS